MAVEFWNCMCAENIHMQGFLHPALNSARAEICISLGQAGLQTLKELEEQTLCVQKWQKARDISVWPGKGTGEAGCSALSQPWGHLWGDWINSKVSVDFPE